jgi:RNA polymerase sigma-70 factor, ECF subfamily
MMEGQMSEHDLLAAAKRGDEDAFGRLVAPFRRELQAHAYRMLGSAADAEDALQDALLGAWRGLARFEERSSLRSWLYTITTNASLKAIRRRPKRVLPVDYGPAADPHEPHGEPLVESVWIEPIPDEHVVDDEAASPEARYEQRESVELAFVAALQHLPARQRAVLILRDVLGFSAREAADMLDTTSVSVDSALQRAHKTVDERLPDQSQQTALRSIEDDELRRIVDAYMMAFESSDITALAELLADEATLAMPPLREWYAGRDAVAAYFQGVRDANRLKDGYRRLIPTRANGQAAAAHYVWDEDAQAFLPHGIHVLGLRGDRISELICFITPKAFDPFDLPQRIEEGGGVSFGT